MRTANMPKQRIISRRPAVGHIVNLKADSNFYGRAADEQNSEGKASRWEALSRYIC